MKKMNQLRDSLAKPLSIHLIHLIQYYHQARLGAHQARMNLLVLWKLKKTEQMAKHHDSLDISFIFLNNGNGHVTPTI
jgi:hypothetical protein